MSKVTDRLAKKRAEWAELALTVAEKPAKFGPDVDFARFEEPTAKSEVASLKSLTKQMKEAALYAGVDAEEAFRSGSYFQVDYSPIYQKVQEMYKGQLEIMSTAEALQKYDWVQDLWWSAVPVDQDKYTARAELLQTHGYFIHVFPGQKVETPIQACLLLSENNVSQNVHNMVVIDEGASAQIITGCTVMEEVSGGAHIGISEFFLRKNADLMFTMIHNWAESFDVRPRSATILEAGATFVNNYILMKPVKSIQMFPAAYLNGDGSRARFNTIISGKKDSYIDVGSRAILKGKNTSSESIARTVGYDESAIYSRGDLISYTNETKAHLDCRGILFSDKAQIWAIPALAADGAPQAELSHEAAISPIAEEEVEYLQTRGLTKDEAMSTITRGFLNIEIPGLPPVLKGYIDHVLDAADKEAL
jgi:Fe-S cluster assembly scaffold protein SufB